MDSIVTLEQQLGTSNRDAIAYAFPSSTGDRTPSNGILVTSPKAIAEVYTGRWLALCPFPGCAGAEYVSFDDPRFFCHECRNAAVGHAFVPVVVPDPTNRRGIEGYLLSRPDRRMRNWLKGEPITDLRDENRALGLKLVKEA